MANESYGEQNLQSPSFLSAQSLFGELKDPSRLTSGEILVNLQAESTFLNPTISTTGFEDIEFIEEYASILGATKTNIDFDIMSGRANLDMVPGIKEQETQKSSSEMMAEEIEKLKQQISTIGSSLKQDVDSQVAVLNSTILSLVSRTNKDFSEEFTVSGAAVGFLFDVRNTQASRLPGWA